MKKLAAVFLALLFASTASAQVISNPTTNARMDGMGVANWQIEDDFNIWINPAQLSNYKNAVYGELGTYTVADAVLSDQRTTTGAWGGMNMDSSYGGWGVYLGRPYAGPLTALPGTAPAANRFDLFYATQNMPLGFYLSSASASSETKAAGVTTTDESSEINLGVGGLVMAGMLDVALNLGLPSSECDAVALCAAGPSGVGESDAGANISLLARHHASAGGGKLLTTFQIILRDTSTKGSDRTSTRIVLGTALNSKPKPDTLLVAGIRIVSVSTEVTVAGTKGTTDNVRIPVNVAIENQTFKKVKTRVGLSKNIYNTAEDATVVGTTITTVTDGAATVSMGFGWAVADNLMLDAVVNQDVLFTGSYLVSGVPESLSSKLSATYRF